MRYIFALFLILSFTGCSIDYENNRRSHFTGTLVDQDGNPLENIRIDLLVETFGFKNSNYPVINSTHTNENGAFDLLTIEPKNEVLYLDFTSSGILSFLRLREIGENNSPYYDLGELKINIPARLEITFKNESGSGETVYAEYTYHRYRPLNDLPQGWVEAYEFDNEQQPLVVQDGRTFIANPEYDLLIGTLLNSEITVRYSIGKPIEESSNVQELNFTTTQREIQYEVIF